MTTPAEQQRAERGAMTNAQRQRRHRDKRRRELEALRAAVANAPAPHTHGQHEQHAQHEQHERDQAHALQLRQLTAKLESTRQVAAGHLARIAVLEVQQLAEQRASQALRDAWRSVLVKLTPAAQHVVRAHLHSCGAAQCLYAATDTPAKPVPPDMGPLSARVFF